jgi:peptidoglycan/LPS O-acetylase OafA/YrhL
MPTAKNSHIEFLDVLRGVAVLAVVGVHVGGGASTITNAQSKWISLTDYGRCGVELFFVLSGILMTHLYLDGDNWNAKEYFLKRAGRLLPLWIVFASISWFGWNWVHATIGAGPDLSGNSQIGLTLLSIPFMGWLSPVARDWLPVGGWSVQAEVGHYLLFPLVRKRISACVNVLIGLQVTEYLLHKYPGWWSSGWINVLAEGWLRLSLASTFLYFAIGYYLVVFLTMRASNTQVPSSVAIRLIFCIGFSAWIPFFAGNNINAFAFIFIATIVGYVASQVGVLKWILLRAGKYSYFMYFSHFWLILIIQVFVQTQISDWPLGVNYTFALMYVVVVFFSMLLGSVSWQHFEQFFVQASRKSARVK